MNKKTPKKIYINRIKSVLKNIFQKLKSYI